MQFISPYQDLAVKQTGANAVITWAGGTLVSGPTVAGPWTPVAGPTTNGSYAVPGTAPNTALFYRMQMGIAPGFRPNKAEPANLAPVAGRNGEQWLWGMR